MVVTRYVVPEAEAVSFRELAVDALDALAARPGCRTVNVGRATDDPTLWLLQSEWDGVGAYRRALSSYDVKARAVPLMYRAVDEPSAYEVVVTHGPDGRAETEPDRAPDASDAAPGR